MVQYLEIGYRVIYMTAIKLETLPLQLISFRNLETIAVSNNKADLTIGKGTFFKTDDGSYGTNIVIGSSRLIKVESGAFQGTF